MATPRCAPSRSFGVILAATACLLLASAAPAFAQTGTVSGTITDAGTGAPVAGMNVSVVTVQGSTVATSSTDASGVYTVTVPIGALYYVKTVPAAGYLPKAFPDVECLSGFCNATDLREAEPFAVPTGGSVTGRNIALARGGAIAGTVTNPSGAATGVVVAAVVRIGTQTITFSALTNAAGAYTIGPVPAGTYFLYTANNQGLRDEIYDDIACTLFCQAATALTSGAPVPVSANNTTAGRDFRLETGGTITGVVTNAATGQPLLNVIMIVAARVNGAVVSNTSTATNANGVYTITGLASGSYSVYANSFTTTNEIYPDLLCVNFCNATTAADSGGRVDVTLGAPTGGINLALEPGLSVSGTVTNEATGQPLSTVVTAWTRVGQNFSGRSVTTNASGQYTVPGLVANTYVLSTSAGQFVNEIYDNLPCTGNLCGTTPQLAAGTPIDVRPGANTSGKNFALQPLGSGTGQVTGTLTDPANGLPIAGIGIELWMMSGANLVGSPPPPPTWRARTPSMGSSRVPIEWTRSARTHIATKRSTTCRASGLHAGR